MKIGLVQAASHQDVFENIKIAEQYLAAAAETGCKVLCFPECFLTGYVPEEAAERSLEKNHEALERLSLLAQTFRIDLLVGFMEKQAEVYYITHGIFMSTGEVKYYHKTHLGEKEEKYFAAGQELEVFGLSCGLKVGFQICVETHFPEITQTLSLKGAEVVFAPHAVPKVAGSRKEIWSKIIPARSYDNRVYMACCNLGEDEKFSGGCMVTDPRGDVVAQYFGESEQFLTAEIAPEEVSKYHGEDAGKRYRYYPAKRRAELYGE